MDISKSFSSEQYSISYTVNTEHDGKRLDQFLMFFMPTFSRENIKKKILCGDIKIEGRPHPHKPSTKIYNNERITLITNKDNLEDEFWRGKLINFEDPQIIFEDENLIVIMKPPFMMTHPSGKHLFYCATVFFETMYKHTIHSVHRIDRETSGILVLAKNPKTANDITPLFEEKKVEKCYFFIAHKKYQHKEFPFTAKERLGPKDNFLPRQFVHCFDVNSNLGKSAQTYFDVIFENDKYILGLASPKTGRQHQIRSHASFHGMPLVGDKMYNGDPAVFMRFKDGLATEDDYNLMDLPRHALHAVAIKFQYQNSQKTFISSLSQDLIDWIAIHLPNEINIDTIQSKIRQKISAKFL